jgi:hypothetical protein
MVRLFLVISLSVLGLPTRVWATDAGTVGSPPESLAHADVLYTQRDTPARMAELQELFAKWAAAPESDYEKLWRAARWKFWQADILPPGEAKKRLGQEGWALAERAVKLQPKKPEGHYYSAVNIGSYSLAVGVLRAIGEGLEQKFHGHLDAALTSDLEYERRAGLVARARAYYEVPWPKRDLGKSEAILKQVVEKHPDNLRAWLYLAETQLRKGEAKKAAESLTKVTQGSIAYDPPEGRRVKNWATWVQSQIERELK